jgi:release factor glutamine methyltransferase
MNENLHTIKTIRQFLSGELNEIYRQEEITTLASILIKTITGIKKLHHLYDPDHRISDEQSERITEMCMELKTGKPVQYVLGETSFYNCTIKLNNTTLIPRPETEELVDLIVKENKGYNGRIIDIGCGSGCISIALAENLPGSIVTGMDISPDAVLLSRENSKLNKVNVSFIRGDLFNYENLMLNTAGIIVSNPPYVRHSEKSFMKKNVLDFEPPLALFVADSDPLKYYKAILKMADTLLLPAGKVYFEINEAMGQSMFELMESNSYSGIEVIQDINGKQRIIKGIRNV